MKSKLPQETSLLITLLIILSITALAGGISLIIEPSGEHLRFSRDELGATYPFDNFRLPGILLVVLFGILPLLLIHPLQKKPRVKWAEEFNIYPKRYWAWTYSLFIGIMLIVWTDIQIYLMGYHSPLQILNSLYGVVIIFVCLMPEQVTHFSKWKMRSDEQNIGNDEEYK